MNRLAIAALLLTTVTRPAGAQWVVNDAATTARNSATAVVKEYLLDTQQRQHERIRQCGRNML